MSDPFFELIKESDIDPKVWRIIKWAFILIVLLVGLGVSIHEFRKGDCSPYYEVIGESYSGRIKKKYLDRSEHMFGTIELEDGRKRRFRSLELTGIFEKLQVGDSLHKKGGELKFTVIRDHESMEYEIKEPDCEKYLSK